MRLSITFPCALPRNGTRRNGVRACGFGIADGGLLTGKSVSLSKTLLISLVVFPLLAAGQRTPRDYFPLQEGAIFFGDGGSGIYVAASQTPSMEQPNERRNLDILSDTMGVDFGPYLSRVLHDVRLNWYKLIPEIARAPEMKKGKVAIEFAIMKDGSLAGMRLVGPSGDVSLDRAAWDGIMGLNPFQPFPSEFRGQYLALRFRFFYNPGKSDLPNPDSEHPSTGISGTSEVEVLVGATRQFILDRTYLDRIYGAATWSVTGEGCSSSACGTITGDYWGFYNAPGTLPKPPVVTITAVSLTDPMLTKSFKVHLVTAKEIAISPTSSRTVSGTTQQFSVTVVTTDGTELDWKTPGTTIPMNWSVFGPGCEGIACGTVSAAGVYTAPATVPSPPNVTVRATLSTDPSKEASATVVIEKPDPSAKQPAGQP